MTRQLAEYFKTSNLALNSVQQYEHVYMNRSSFPWQFDGPDGKFTAYNWSAQVFAQTSDTERRLHAVNEIRKIVIQWMGDTKAVEKYGKPGDILDLLLESNSEFQLGGLDLIKLEERHFQPLGDFLDSVKIIKSLKRNRYPWVTVSKFLHILNPCLFPIYDITHMWRKVMEPTSGTFGKDYNEFCKKPDQRHIALSVEMEPDEWGCKFNANYTYWAKEHIIQAAPDLMPYFGRWFCDRIRNEPDPYDLKRYANQLYGLAFEVIALGAACVERNGA